MRRSLYALAGEFGWLSVALPNRRLRAWFHTAVDIYNGFEERLEERSFV